MKVLIFPFLDPERYWIKNLVKYYFNYKNKTVFCKIFVGFQIRL